MEEGSTTHREEEETAERREGKTEGGGQRKKNIERTLKGTRDGIFTMTCKVLERNCLVKVCIETTVAGVNVLVIKMFLECTFAGLERF